MAEAKNKKTAEKKAAIKNENKNITINKNSKDNKSVIIAILATVLGCLIIAVIVFVALLASGVIKIGGINEPSSVNVEGGNGTEIIETGGSGGGSTGSSSGVIDNPNKRVTVNGTLAQVGDLEFYLPKKFKSGGKNNDGAYTFNLTDDDGWAQVVVYAENSSQTAKEFLLKKSPYLDITDENYKMNGTSWVEGENASMLAYATKLDGKVYAIIYSVKLDSDATSEAMSMIPKTLYMKKIYK